MARLSNPLNTLFGKLLLAFTVTAVLTAITLFGVSFSQQQWQSHPASKPMAKLMERVAAHVEANPDQSLRQLSRKLQRFKELHFAGNEPLPPSEGRDRGNGKRPPHRSEAPIRAPRLELHLVDAQGNILGTKRHRPRSLKQFLVDFEPDQALRQQQFERHLFVGPKLLSNNKYLVLQLNRPPKPWLSELQRRPWLPLLLITVIATLVFGLLAWTLRKPLKQLRTASHAIATGQLNARVDERTTGRGDEFGQVGRSFNQMADSVTSMVTSQQRLLSDISHELRTPLTRLQLGLAIAERKGQQSKELDRIRTDADQLEAMLQELLSLSRLNQPDQYQKNQLDLVQTLAPVLEGVEFEAQQQHTDFQVSMPPSIHYFGNDILLQRMIENPLRNALRHANNTIVISVIEQQQQIEIAISDDGPGVPEAQLALLFKPFHRVDEARNREHGGWGLGLAITQAAVEAHQGKIVAENRQQGGLRIRIVLPHL